MITVRLIGGLGNQIFQYSLGRNLALKHNTDLLLDLSWFDNIDPAAGVPRAYELDCFDIKATTTRTAAAQYEGVGRVGAYMRHYGMRDKKLIVDRNQGFDAKVLDAPDGAILNGWWQDEEYFIANAEAIRRDLVFVKKPSADNVAMSKKIAASTSVSLHIRRGDYVSRPETTEFHGLTPLDYYYRAIKELVKQVPKPTFYVFSDDPEWCKENLKLDYPVVFVDHNPGDKGYEDMRLMSQCQHHILANSSFSWWGAWLDASPSNIVIAQKDWFKDPVANAHHRLPKAWIQL